MAKTKSIQIVRTDRFTSEIEVISLSEAKLRLSGNWQQHDIEPMLLDGKELWTPFATYSIFTNP